MHRDSKSLILTFAKQSLWNDGFANQPNGMTNLAEIFSHFGWRANTLVREVFVRGYAPTASSSSDG